MIRLRLNYKLGLMSAALLALSGCIPVAESYVVDYYPADYYGPALPPAAPIHPLPPAPKPSPAHPQPKPQPQPKPSPVHPDRNPNDGQRPGGNPNGDGGHRPGGNPGGNGQRPGGNPGGNSHRPGGSQRH